MDKLRRVPVFQSRKFLSRFLMTLFKLFVDCTTVSWALGPCTFGRMELSQSKQYYQARSMYIQMRRWCRLSTILLVLRSKPIMMSSFYSSLFPAEGTFRSITNSTYGGHFAPMRFFLYSSPAFPSFNVAAFTVALWLFRSCSLPLSRYSLQILQRFRFLWQFF